MRADASDAFWLLRRHAGVTHAGKARGGPAAEGPLQRARWTLRRRLPSCHGQVEVVKHMTGPLETHDRAAQLVQYRPRVYRHLLALTRDPALADDLTQETFLRAVSHIGQLRDHGAALGWLYRIATNTMVDHVRRTRGADTPTDPERLADTGAATPLRRSPGPSPQTTAERSEMSACVDRHLASLPDDYRVALLLHDGHGGLTNPQIAAQVQCSVATVKIRVHRARARLRAALTGACDFGADDRGELVCEQR